MKAIRKWLAVEYKIRRGLALWFVTVAVVVQLLWPSFANSWTGSFIVIGAAIAVAVMWRVARAFR